MTSQVQSVIDPDFAARYSTRTLQKAQAVFANGFAYIKFQNVYPNGKLGRLCIAELEKTGRNWRVVGMGIPEARADYARIIGLETNGGTP